MCNAHNLHPDPTAQASNSVESSDKTMRNYVLRGERQEQVATFAWCWKMILSRRLFNTEGVWITSRMVIIQVAMVIEIIALVTGTVAFIHIAAEEADTATASLDDNLPQFVYDLVPTGAQVKWALYPALAVAICIMLVLFLILVPR